MVVMQGIHHFPLAICVAADAIGISRPVEVGGVAGTLHLPAAPTTTYSPKAPWPHLTPPAALKTALFDELSSVRWGAPTSIPPPPAAIAYYHVSAGLFSFEIALSDDPNTIGHKVREDLDAWWQRLCTWLQAYSGQRLDATRPPVDARERISRTKFYRVDVDGRVRSARKTEAHIELYIDPNPSTVSVDQWSSAVRRTSNKEELPLEHRFLNDAVSALHAFDGRRAVLDAATAVELCVGKALEAELSKATAHAALRTLVRKEFDSLDKMVKALLALGAPIRQDSIQQSIAKPRNRTIHAGAEQSPEEVRRSVEVATQVVRQLSPLAL